MLARPAPAPGIIVEDLDDDVCLYRPVVDEIVVLNRSARDVWRLADGNVTLEEIVDRLARAYEVSPGVVRPDVERVIGDLSDRGFFVEARAEQQERL